MIFYSNNDKNEGIIRYADGEVYEGELKDKYIKHGYGRMRYSDGVYQGDWKNDKKHGREIGIYKYNNGNIYIGYWKNDKKIKDGIMKYANKDQYYGKIDEEDKRHGNGQMIYANKDVYKGEWANDKRHGKGKYIFIKTGDTFEGEWENDEPKITKFEPDTECENNKEKLDPVTLDTIDKGQGFKITLNNDGKPFVRCYDAETIRKFIPNNSNGEYLGPIREPFNEYMEKRNAYIWKKNTEPEKKGGKTKKGRKWSNKYKKSINCKKPRGFSQRQYCKYGRRKSQKRS